MSTGREGAAFRNSGQRCRDRCCVRDAGVLGVMMSVPDGHARSGGQRRACCPTTKATPTTWCAGGGNGSDWTMNRILVTGGAGFLGSHLCERLLQQGHDVICADNYFTGNKANIAHLLDNPRFEVIRHDITEPLHLYVDQIYNLACPASPVHYQMDPIHTIKTSVLGSINMLGLARRTGARCFLASTSEVYGDPHEHPQKENYWGNVNPNGVRSCYDEGKRCAEALFFDYHRRHDLPIKVVRIFNTYGPRMHPQDGRVVSNFIVQALRGDPLTLYGDGSQTRSFCYVDDMVDGFIRMMGSADDFLGPVNLGNPEEFTMIELAETVLRLTGSSSRIVRQPLPLDDPKRRRPDIALARSALGWEPTIKLEQGVAKTIAHFERLLAGELTSRDRAAADSATRLHGLVASRA
jgi:UDP-glucuronate decarboxylase